MSSELPLGGSRSIPSGWILYAVDDIKAEEKYACVAGPFGSSISSKYFTESGVPIIRGSNLRDDLTRFVAQDFAFVSEQQAKNYPAQHVRSGDLVFTCWGTIGQVGIIPEDGPYQEYIISNKQLKLRVNPELADSLFVYYYLASKEGVEHIRSRAIGSAVPGINLGILKSLKLALPPLTKQQQIVDILSNYDRLIDNNTRRIALLEESIHRLYKEWFVYLRFPGCDRVEVIDGIPEGWEILTISDLYLTSSGGTPSRKKEDEYYSGGSIRWIKNQELSDRWILDTEEKITEAGLSNSSAKLFPEDTFIVAMYGATIGRFGILAEQCSTNQACCALISKPNSLFNYAYAFGYFLSEREKIIGLGQGSAQPNISQKVIKDLKIFKPSVSVMENYNLMVEPILQSILCCQRQNQKLREARDLLLPRLMNGSIPV